MKLIAVYRHNIFHASISLPNNTIDEYSFNNNLSSTFEPAPTYPNTFALWVQTNSGSIGGFSETSWEITDNNGQIVTGPPTLTRFEKARIMGARALQLSLGAPVFIEIPKNATTSLEIAMEELKQRVIPIIIKRTLPNGAYQNLSIDQFE